jgi:hypothetical protein
MALTLRRGRVSAVVERHEGLVRIDVDGSACVAYPGLTGPVALDDEVLVNVQARELALGSGGFDVLYANLTRGLELAPAENAHVMKLPYTPLQFAVRHAEEDGPLAELAPVCAALAGRRVADLQLPGGALPVPLSDVVRVLRARELLNATVGVGACFGGDVDCVSVYSALAWTKAQGMDVAVCALGPGIAGTGTRFGHGGMAAGEALNAASDLGGRPILALRLSEADPRPRHRGVSHHTEAILSLRGPSVVHPWPEGCPIEHSIAEGADVIDVSGWREACAGLPLLHMGRGPDDDPWFFAAAFAAGVAARRLLS